MSATTEPNTHKPSRLGKHSDGSPGSVNLGRKPRIRKHLWNSSPGPAALLSGPFYAKSPHPKKGAPVCRRYASANVSLPYPFFFFKDYRGYAMILQLHFYLHEAFHPLQRLGQLSCGSCIGAADMPFASASEHMPGNSGNSCFLQQPQCKFLRPHSGAGNRRKA